MQKNCTICNIKKRMWCYISDMGDKLILIRVISNCRQCESDVQFVFWHHVNSKHGSGTHYNINLFINKHSASVFLLVNHDCLLGQSWTKVNSNLLQLAPDHNETRNTCLNSWIFKFLKTLNKTSDFNTGDCCWFPILPPLNIIISYYSNPKYTVSWVLIKYLLKTKPWSFPKPNKNCAST